MRAIICAAIMAVTFPSVVHAGEFKDWRRVGQWQISRNVNDQACQLSSMYEGDGETILMVTYTPSTDTASLGIGNKGCQSLREDAAPIVTLDFGAAGKWKDVKTTVIITDEYRWLSMNFDGKAFITDFAVSPSLLLTRDDTIVDRLNLKNSKEAVIALVECGTTMNKGIARDPFK